MKHQLIRANPRNPCNPWLKTFQTRPLPKIPSLAKEGISQLILFSLLDVHCLPRSGISEFRGRRRNSANSAIRIMPPSPKLLAEIRGSKILRTLLDSPTAVLTEKE